MRRRRPAEAGAYAVDFGARGASFERAGWRTDFSRHTVPLAEIRRGGPSREGIRPIDRLRVRSRRATEGRLAGRAPVVAVEVGGVARASPLRVLVWHEVVNDRLGGGRSRSASPR